MKKIIDNKPGKKRERMRDPWTEQFETKRKRNLLIMNRKQKSGGKS